MNNSAARHRLPRLLLSTLVTCSLLLGFSSLAAADGKQEKQLDNLKRSISSLEKKLEDRDKERDNLQTGLKKIELKASKINSNVRRLRNKINNLEAKLKKLNKQQNDLQQGIDGQSAAIVEQIAAAYKLGNQEPIKLLLNHD